MQNFERRREGKVILIHQQAGQQLIENKSIRKNSKNINRIKKLVLTHTKIRNRTGLGYNIAFGEDGDIMKINPPLSLRGRLFNLCILPVLIHGSKLE